MISLSACNMGNRQPLTRSYNAPNNGLAPYSYDNYNRNGTTYDRYGVNQFGNVYNGRDRYYTYNANVNDEADRMANVAARVSGVNNATVVLFGRTAYVALDLQDKVQKAKSTQVENKVYRALKKFTTNRYTISITSDADLFGRLRDIGDGVRSGTPIDQYRNNFRTFDNRFRSNY